MDRKKRVVVALGGNALGNNFQEQKEAAKASSLPIVDLIEEGYQVIVSHGNGPQVGKIYKAMEVYEANTLYMAGAMSQTYIGFDLENAIREELKKRKLGHIPLVTLMTQIKVEEDKDVFENPTKPIGEFLNEKEAEALRVEKNYHVEEDSGRGYRRMVPSPLPKEIVEIQSIRTLVDNGHIVIACGGGGIPVLEEDGLLKGLDAVIDKDHASSLLAQELGADFLLILTAVEKVAINFNQEGELGLDRLSVEEAKSYIEEGHFMPGSMLPKIRAGIDFAQSKKGRVSLITHLEKAREGLMGKTGTRIEL